MQLNRDVVEKNAPFVRDALPPKYHHFFDALVETALQQSVSTGWATDIPVRGDLCVSAQPAVTGVGHKCGGGWLIFFDDADRKPEVFTDRAAALRRWEQISVSWNAHLFERIAVNSRDAIPADAGDNHG